MNSNLHFRGYAGEIVAGFLSPKTILTLVGMLMILVPLAVILGLIFNSAGSLIMTPIIFSIFGRFAIQASRGDFHCGISGSKLKKGESFRFALLLIATNLAWFIPWILCFWSFIKSFSGLHVSSMLMGVSSYTSPLIGAMFIATLICGPSLAGIFATAIFSEEFDDLKEIFDWLLEKREDLVAFYAAAIGGIILFIAVYSIPVVALIGILASANPAVAVVVGVVSWSIPSVGAIILMGRLTGAFVASEISSSFSSDEGEKLVTTIMQSELASKVVVANKPSVIDSPAKKIGLSRADVRKRIEGIKTTTQEEIAASIGQLESLVQEAPMIPDAHIALMQALIAAGNVQAAVAKLPRAVELGLGNGMNTEVVKVFQSTNLSNWESAPWKGNVLKDLSQACERQKNFNAAWWCALQLLKSDTGQTVEIQKWCYEIAERAKENGAEEESLKLFKHFSELFPESKFIDFVRREILQIESNLRITGRSLS